MTDLIVKQLIDMANNNPQLASVLMVMAIFRVVFKPIFALADAYVQATENKEDDAKLEEIKSSKLVITLAFILDYFASVKIK